jgi:plastocyanin
VRTVIVSTVLTALATGMFASVACGGDDENNGSEIPSLTASAAAETLLIELDDFYFEPESMQGKLGQTLEITAFSEGQQTHTLTIDELGVDREFPASDTQIFPLTLTKAGEFKVYCRYHQAQGMTATFSVSE